MKTRNGFVSNSSSSSFLIYGADLANQKDEIISVLGLDEEIDNYELAETIAAKAGLEFSSTGECWDSIYVGRSWDSIKDDETGLAFKKSIEKALADALGLEVKCGTCEEAWRDG